MSVVVDTMEYLDMLQNEFLEEEVSLLSDQEELEEASLLSDEEELSTPEPIILVAENEVLIEKIDNLYNLLFVVVLFLVIMYVRLSFKRLRG